MKLHELRSSFQPQDAKLSIRLSLSGLLLSAILFVVIIVASIDGPVNGGASPSLAASELFQDELQIQLGSGGFTPGEVQRAAGTFAIAVENSAIPGEYTLRLKAADDTVVREVQVQKGSAAWTVTLSAGEYTLTEASHPQWLCRITVQ